MKVPNIRDHRENASTVDPKKRAMYGNYRGDTEKMGIATYWPRAGAKDYETRKLPQNVLTAGKKK